MTIEELVAQLAEELKPYNMSVQEFIDMTLDDMPDYNLRDLKLMTKGIL